MNLALPAKTKVETYVTLHHFIETAPSWYVLKKGTAYLVAFIDFLQCKNMEEKFTKPKLDASYLERAMERLVVYTPKESFGKAGEKLQAQNPDCFQDYVKSLAKTASSKQ